MYELRRRAQALLDRPPVPLTPVVELRRRARRRRARRNITAAVATVAAIGCVAAVVARIADGRTPSHVQVEPTTPTTRFAGPVGWPETFVSTRVSESATGAPTSTVAISDARTGRALRTLYTLPSDGTRVSGTAIAPGGDIWITVNRGPKMLGHTADGNPQPHTCASTVMTVDPHSGASRTVFTGGDDELLTDAQPSPDGHRVAYLHGGCAAARTVERLEVRQLDSGQVTDLHVSSTPCNSLFDPRWTADGRDLAFGQADSGQDCNTPAAAKLAVVSAEPVPPTTPPVSVATAPNCSVAAVTTTADGFASVEQCRAPNSQFPEPIFIDGPVQLVRYDRDLKPMSRVSLGQCDDGASIAGTPRSQTVIVSNYQFCAGGASSPANKLFVDDPAGRVAADTGLRLITTIYLGETAIDQLSF
jgi:hypothetical protein